MRMPIILLNEGYRYGYTDEKTQELSNDGRPPKMMINKSISDDVSIQCRI